MKSKLLFFLSIVFNLYFINAQNQPGGVPGAEVWYISNWDNIENGVFPNSAQTDITINKCGETEKSLFNFNPSIFVEKLCLEYIASLENTTGRNVFFVGEPEKPNSFSHLGTLWRENFVPIFETESIIRNFFDFNNKNVFTNEIYADYTSNKNANVNFYHTNNYTIDKKFKSYGQEGETTFSIGEPTQIDSNQSYEDNYFNGSFPEFISFPREISDNERNRVESYLALKYGLTLNRNISYLSSKNIVFWDEANNHLFPERIFGFGKDVISGLTQLQSESTHLKDHLVSAIEAIAETNMEKQQERIRMPNDHFLVFGDNDRSPSLINENEYGIKFWDKVWLAQRTGRIVDQLPIHFKLFLTDELVDYLTSNPEETLWFLQDKHVGNDEVSEFDSEHIEFYAGEIDWQNKTAYFKDVFFDSDRSTYDQFTFGVGPQMIVQAQVQGCKTSQLKIVLDITGGSPNYHIAVESSQGNIVDTTSNNTYTFSVQPNITYNIVVHDSQGVVTEVEITPELWSYNLYLGSDKYLTSGSPEVTLDAGQGINDPDATYEWYHDGVLLPETESTLTVDEVGEYEVVVTNGDLSCVISDSIQVLFKYYKVTLTSINGCDPLHNSLTVNINGGFPNYVTSLEGIDGVVNYAHSGTTTLTDIPYGSYIVTVTDSEGQTFVEVVDFVAPQFELDLVSQLETICSSCLYYPGDFEYPNSGYEIPFFNNLELEFTIDASVLISGTTATYKWFLNDILISEEPSITFDNINSGYCYDDPIYDTFDIRVLRVEISGIDNSNCFLTESFLFKGNCPNRDNETPQLTPPSQNNSALRTAVYPNPSEPNATFTYEATATEVFEATVEVFTVTGAKLSHTVINGKSAYRLPFNLQSAGMYFIRTTSSLGVKTDKIIIK
ncbi:T9SS type A sorting domain-containing protein [Gaetbulibacter sp. PBL-D1]|uniref:T9SS type A sorting domain-containing protein n=1 Tax=Gaetbulibacter sp. PBL-D1 TaxID=3422594 RepID=UPI003D2ED53B